MPLVALAPPGGSNDLDRYELLFRFAAGGMAEVFVARQRGEGGFLRPVAIKRMLPALAEEPKFVEMFLDEARLAAHVTSPYVVSTLDCGKDEEGSPYIVMELVVGVSLSQALRAAAEKRRHVPHPVIAEILAQTAIGLHDAHEAKTPTGQPLRIVHRDVSPQNVLLGVDGRARLTDFGVARALERVTRTATGEVKGKLSYFSPEQARMEPLDQRSDIFALGIVAWESLALERLFSRESPMAALTAILHERIADPREHNPDIPEKLAKVVMRALERDMSLRYPTARMFADELRAAVGTPANATAIGRWVEESGGPRLETFRKKIETSFRARRSDRPPDPNVAAENERSSPSSASNAAGFSSNPESKLVGSLGTLPDRPVDIDGSVTDVRAGRTPVSQAGADPYATSMPGSQASGVASGVVSLVSSTRVASNPGYEVPVVVAAPQAPPRSRAPLFVGGAIVALTAIGVGTAALVLGTTAPPDTALAPLPTTVIATPPTTTVGPSTPAGTDPPPLTTTSTEHPLPPQTATAIEAHPRRTEGSRTGTRSEAAPGTGATRVVDDTPTRETPTRETTTTQTTRTETTRTEAHPEATQTETTRTAETTRTEATRTETAGGSGGSSRSAGSEGDPEPPATGRLRVGTGAGRLRGSTP